MPCFLKIYLLHLDCWSMEPWDVLFTSKYCSIQRHEVWSTVYFSPIFLIFSKFVHLLIYIFFFINFTIYFFMTHNQKCYNWQPLYNLLGSMSVSGQLWTFPSPNPTVTLNLLSVDCFWVREGVGGLLLRQWHWSIYSVLVQRSEWDIPYLVD